MGQQGSWAGGGAARLLGARGGSKVPGCWKQGSKVPGGWRRGSKVPGAGGGASRYPGATLFLTNDWDNFL